MEKFFGRNYNQDDHQAAHRHATPLLNTSVYKVEFQDGYIQEYLASTIA